MNRGKIRKLERGGWRVDPAAEFLGLTAEEAAIIETRLALAEGIRRWRQRRGLTQTEVAVRLGSSQSRVAKMEAGDHAVTIDLMMRALLCLGASQHQVARIISNGPDNRGSDL